MDARDLINYQEVGILTGRPSAVYLLQSGDENEHYSAIKPVSDCLSRAQTELVLSLVYASHFTMLATHLTPTPAMLLGIIVALTMSASDKVSGTSSGRHQTV